MIPFALSPRYVLIAVIAVAVVSCLGYIGYLRWQLNRCQEKAKVAQAEVALRVAAAQQSSSTIAELEKVITQRDTTCAREIDRIRAAAIADTRRIASLEADRQRAQQCESDYHAAAAICDQEITPPPDGVRCLSADVPPPTDRRLRGDVL